MATVKLSAWLDDVMPNLAGSPAIALVESKVRQAAIELCGRSHCLAVDHDPIAIVSGESVYDLFLDNISDVVRVESASLDGNEIELAEGIGYVIEGGSQLKFLSEPTGSGVLSLSVSLRPKQMAAVVDDSLFRDFREAIASGALYRMMAMPKKPWTDGRLAALHRDIFEGGIRAASAQAIKRGTRVPLRTRTYGA